MKRFVRGQFGFLLWGLAFVLPIAILFFVLVFLFNNIEDIGRRIFLLFVSPRFYYSGFGIALGVLLVYLSGIVLKTTKIRVRLAKVPILGLLFGGGEVITVDRLTNLTPCLFMYSPTLLSYGWILSEERVKVGDEDAQFTLMNVYYPNVPTLITGQVFPARKDTVMKLGNPSKEVIDLLLYAFRSPSALRYLPWEDESHEEFEARAMRFGINVDQK